MSKLPVPVGVAAIDKPEARPVPALAVNSAAAAWMHALTTRNLALKHSERLAQNCFMSVSLSARLWDPVVWNEWMQLQAAVWRRLQKQGRDWHEGCEVLVEDYALVRNANTMSKLVEKQCNLMTQSAQLMTSQSTNFMALLENIDVDYNYWANQKAQVHRAA